MMVGKKSLKDDIFFPFFFFLSFLPLAAHLSLPVSSYIVAHSVFIK